MVFPKTTDEISGIKPYLLYQINLSHSCKEKVNGQIELPPTPRFILLTTPFIFTVTAVSLDTETFPAASFTHDKFGDQAE